MFDRVRLYIKVDGVTVTPPAGLRILVQKVDFTVSAIIRSRSVFKREGSTTGCVVGTGGEQWLACSLNAVSVPTPASS